jgi:hypothetical protein
MKEHDAEKEGKNLVGVVQVSPILFSLLDYFASPKIGHLFPLFLRLALVNGGHGRLAKERAANCTRYEWVLSTAGPGTFLGSLMWERERGSSPPFCASVPVCLPSPSLFSLLSLIYPVWASIASFRRIFHSDRETRVCACMLEHAYLQFVHKIDKLNRVHMYISIINQYKHCNIFSVHKKETQIEIEKKSKM